MALPTSPLATASSDKLQLIAAPAWSGPDGFIKYEEEVTMWLHVTTLPDDKKGAAMRMSLTGVAGETSRSVKIAVLLTSQGHVKLLEVLRVAFGGSEANRGVDSYLALSSLRRGDQSMEDYLAAMGVALADCHNNGYTMSAKMSSAVVLEQAGLDSMQRAATLSAAAVNTIGGAAGVNAMSTALRDLWGRGKIGPSSAAVMVAMSHAEHQAFLARRHASTPKPRPAPRTDTRTPALTDKPSCWYCGKPGHVERECRKKARESAARRVAPPPAPAPPAATDNEAGVVNEEQVHVILSAADGVRMAGRAGDVILDIGATATIAGAEWLAEYVALLPPSERTAISTTQASAVFTFGGGNQQRAHERIIIPLMIGSHRCLVKVWVVAGDLPMLMSRPTMSSLGIVLDVKNQLMAVSTLGIVVKVTLSPAGHLTFNALSQCRRMNHVLPPAAANPEPVPTAAMSYVAAATLLPVAPTSVAGMAELPPDANTVTFSEVPTPLTVGAPVVATTAPPPAATSVRVPASPARAAAVASTAAVLPAVCAVRGRVRAASPGRAHSWGTTSLPPGADRTAACRAALSRHHDENVTLQLFLVRRSRIATRAVEAGHTARHLAGQHRWAADQALVSFSGRGAARAAINRARMFSHASFLARHEARRMSARHRSDLRGYTSDPTLDAELTAWSALAARAAVDGSPNTDGSDDAFAPAVLTRDTPGLARAAMKLHTQYGHCVAGRLNALLKDQGVTDTEVFAAVDKAASTCTACHKTAPRPSRPLVAVPHTRRFNDAVAVDLAEVAPHSLFLHMVDLGTRYAKAVALPNKEAPTVARALVTGWLVHHGPPRTLLADSGGEFDSAVWRVTAERFNITVASTAAQAHFSNGVVERHNRTLKTMVTRLRADHPSAGLQELLDLACLAKNAMGVHLGASPFQLMCGSTPRVPSALTDGLPALAVPRVPGDDALHAHLELLRDARRAHTLAEANSSLRRALARNATNVPPCTWKAGDSAYYWTEGVRGSVGSWHGPADVTDVAVAKDAVRLQHGATWLNRHTSQIRPVGRSPGAGPAPTPTAPSGGTGAPGFSRRDTAAGPPPAGGSSSNTSPVYEEQPSSNEADSPYDAAHAIATKNMLAAAAEALRRASLDRPPSPAPSPRRGRTRSATLQRHRATRAAAVAALLNTHVPLADTLPASLSRAGVSDHQALITRREMRRRSEVPLRDAGRAFDVAITDELTAWADLAVYAEVPFAGQTVLPMKWVLTIKVPDDPTAAARRKARLCVRGDRDPDRDGVDSTSPTASRATLRVCFSALATHGFTPRTVDVRTAFLQGMPLDRPRAVFVRPPVQAGVPDGLIWQLRKCAYGLTDAPRRWYESVLALMERLGLRRSVTDHGLFTRHKAGRLVLLVAVHVDDFLFGGTNPWLARFETGLRSSFTAGLTDVGRFSFTGLRVRTAVDDDTGSLTIRVDQDRYIDSIDVITVIPARAEHPDAALTTNELTEYRRATGALLWVTGQTMPYLACAASLLARRFLCGVVRDLTTANRTVAATKAMRPLPLIFSSLRGPQRLRLFTDASSVRLGEPTAHSGFAVFATPATVPAGCLAPDAPLTLLDYASRKQRRVTHSSFAAEVYALLEGMRAVKELAAVHAVVYTGDEHAQPAVDVYIDSLSLYNTLDADGVVQPKEVGAAVHELRELYRGGACASITWLRARGQLADALTKPARNTPLEHCIRTGKYNVRLAASDYLTKQPGTGVALLASEDYACADDETGDETERTSTEDAETDAPADSEGCM